MKKLIKIGLISAGLISQAAFADFYCPAYITCGINDNNCVPSSLFPEKLYQRNSSFLAGKYIFQTASVQANPAVTQCGYQLVGSGLVWLFSPSKLNIDKNISDNQWKGDGAIVAVCGGSTSQISSQACPFLSTSEKPQPARS